MRTASRLVAMAVAALLLGACSPPPVEQAQARAVRVVEQTGAADGGPVRIYAGEVRARHETDVAFRIGGKLVARTVQVGDRVRRGDVLARLDPQDVRLAAGAAAAQLAAAEADLALARAELARAEELHARAFISASALDGRRSALQAAEAAVRAARAQADSAGNQASYADLLADHDAVVLNTYQEAGAVLAAGQPVLRLARPETREVLIHVPESRIAGLAPGAPATVRPWARPERSFEAVVRELAPAADAATRSFAVRVSVPQADDSLPLGATASVAFAMEETGGLQLPLSALTQVDGRPAIWLVDTDDRVRPLPVQIDEYREDVVIVRVALPAGARVVAGGVHKLVEGETVRVVSADAPVRLDARR